MKKAMLYKKMDRGNVRCSLCSHRCVIKTDETGKCKVRKNIGGELFSLNYDKVAATHVDPIEKKPLFHFKPGSKSFSIATVGCNFTCTFCQNYDMSQWLRDTGSAMPGRSISPEELAREAMQDNCKTIAYTYTEPTIFAELAYDTAIEARKLDIDSVFVSNGYMTEEMIAHFGQLIAAANIDLKTFNNENYKKTIGGKLEPVLESIKNLHENKSWLEITTLLIPEFNDSDEELNKIAEFIAGVDKSIPWHVSAFHPTYRMNDRDRTNLDLLNRAYKIGKSAGLMHVYMGNVIGDRRESTFCPKCNNIVIERSGYSVININMANGKCSNCNSLIAGVFENQL